MRILFLSHYFPPEVNAPANRTIEHCTAWVRLGHEVHVVTCVPSHPRGIAFQGYKPGWYVRERVDGIEVHRVWSLLAANTGMVRRTLNYLSFVPSAVWRALLLGRFDIIVATSPQFFCALAGYLSGAIKRTPWVFELRDLWPDSVAAVGAVRRGVLLRALERLELRMYRHARLVVCVTRSFMLNLERRGINREKLAFVPNGIDVGMCQAGDPEAARRRLGIGTDEVLVSYVGTVGMAHGLRTILDAAHELSHREPRIRFLIVGDGAELSALRRHAGDGGLSNVHFTGLVPRAAAKDYLDASDICLVTLKRSPVFRTVLPSKLFEAMAAGKPVILGVEGEAREVLEASGGGIAVEPENQAQLCDAIARLAAAPDLRLRLGTAGREFVAREFNRTTWARTYLSLLAAACGRAA